MVLQFVPGWRRDIMMYVYGQFHMAGRGGQCGNTSGRRCRNSVTPCNPALIRDRYTSHLHYISTLSTVCSRALLSTLDPHIFLRERNPVRVLQL